MRVSELIRGRRGHTLTGLGFAVFAAMLLGSAGSVAFSLVPGDPPWARRASLAAALLGAAGGLVAGASTAWAKLAGSLERRREAAFDELAGRDPLFAALRADSVEGLRAALDAGADPNAPMANGDLPLVAVVRSRRLKLARLLLERGARPEAKDPSGMSALDVEAPEIYRRVLRGEEGPNAQDERR